jgi:hypothetical protein
MELPQILPLIPAHHPELGPDFGDVLIGEIADHVNAILHTQRVHWVLVSRETGALALASHKWTYYTLLDEADVLVPGPNFRLLATGNNCIELDAGNDNSNEYHLTGLYEAKCLIALPTPLESGPFRI